MLTNEKEDKKNNLHHHNFNIYILLHVWTIPLEQDHKNFYRLNNCKQWRA